jgi:hypothetical protein
VRLCGVPMTSTERPGYTRDLLASKIQWEGGIIATLEYGLRSEDIEDGHLRVIWRDLEVLYDKMRPKIVEMRRALTAEPVPLDRNGLMASAHYAGCIDQQHSLDSPCYGYSGSWAVRPLGPADDAPFSNEWQERDE